MTISAAEFDRRFEDHVSAARLAKGDVILKSSAYYGESLSDAAVQEKVKQRCREIDIRGQFVSGLYGGNGLRLWTGNRHGTE